MFLQTDLSCLCDPGFSGSDCSVSSQPRPTKLVDDFNSNSLANWLEVEGGYHTSVGCGIACKLQKWLWNNNDDYIDQQK